MTQSLNWRTDNKSHWDWPPAVFLYEYSAVFFSEKANTILCNSDFLYLLGQKRSAPPPFTIVSNTYHRLVASATNIYWVQESRKVQMKLWLTRFPVESSQFSKDTFMLGSHAAQTGLIFLSPPCYFQGWVTAHELQPVKCPHLGFRASPVNVWV